MSLSHTQPSVPRRSNAVMAIPPARELTATHWSNAKKGNLPASMRSRLHRCFSLFTNLGLATVAALYPTAPTFAQPWPAVTEAGTHPEGESGRTSKPIVRAREWLAVTAHPLASEAAHNVLAEGGSAVDAAIAAQAVLSLVEPQSSGLGGGGFLLHYDPLTRKVGAYDGRETAPAHTTAELFQHPDGRLLGHADAVVGGRSVGVPGLMRMLELAHAEHGRLPWARLFAPAIELARQGFEVSPRLHTLLTRERWLSMDSEAAALFYGSDGRPVPVGHRLRNAALADTLETIARHGATVLYEGPVADDIVRRVRSHPSNPGSLDSGDLSGYRPIRRDALCTPFRQWLVCGMPPPSAGAIAISQILRMYDQAATRATPAAASTAAATHGERAHRFTEAVRLAFADRDRWVADPGYVPVPVTALVAENYLNGRARMIGERSLDIAPPGDPLRAIPRLSQPADTLQTEREATTHLSIIDAAGRAVAMTSSIEDAFGSRVMVRGFLLNNQLTDFSWRRQRGDEPDVNRVEPGKRPRSSMSPTLVFGAATADRSSSSAEVGERQLMLVLGSPGGPAIISYVARALLDVLVEGTPLQQAIEAPNLASRNGPTEIENTPAAAALADTLKARGHRVRIGPMTSGLHGIIRSCDITGAACLLESGTDPRREGLARGR